VEWELLGKINLFVLALLDALACKNAAPRSRNKEQDGVIRDCSQPPCQSAKRNTSTDQEAMVFHFEANAMAVIVVRMITPLHVNKRDSPLVQRKI
jgi:hypothetical protein